MKKLIVLIMLMSFVCMVTFQTVAQGCAENILEVGNTGRVLGDPNRIREAPNTGGRILGEIGGETTFVVLEIGECSDGIQWLRVDSNGLIDWTAESSDGEAFVARVQVVSEGFYELVNASGRSGVISLNADGTVLARGGTLYNANNLSEAPRQTIGEGSSLFSPTNPNLLFRYFEDYDFTLVDIRDNSIVWSELLPEPGGIGGVYAQVAYFSADGNRLIFSSSAEGGSSWAMLDLPTLTTTFFARGYYGEAVSFTANDTVFTRSVTRIDESQNTDIFNFDLSTLDSTGEISTEPIDSNILDILYISESRLLAHDGEHNITLWNANLSYVGEFASLEGSQWVSWAIGDYLVVIEYTAENPENTLHIRFFDPPTLEQVAELKITEINFFDPYYADVIFHPDGRLGLRVANYFRWLDIDAILDGTITELQLFE